AESEMNAARFNIQRKAWLAAAERAQWVIEHYPQTPQTPEALATLAYSYQKLGDNSTAQQYIEILKLNYPNLVKSNGEVNLRAARKEGSWVNRATLGLLGRESKTVEVKEEVKSEAQQRSLTNRLSFGLLDKSETESTSQPEAVVTPVVPAENNKPSWTNRLSFGLLDKPEATNSSEDDAAN
ncbi:MAG: outer membrane protein assembly factor BamD, partial [Acinetobacter junii]